MCNLTSQIIQLVLTTVVIDNGIEVWMSFFVDYLVMFKKLTVVNRCLKVSL